MTTSTISPQPRLASAWTSFAFLYAYVDILNFFKPGVLDSILDGKVWEFDVSPALLTFAFISVAIPCVMVVLSMALPARVNRMTNLVVAVLLVPYTVFNIAGASSEWIVFYVVSISIELALLVFVLRSAWKWTVAAPTRAEERLRR